MFKKSDIKKGCIVTTNRSFHQYPNNEGIFYYRVYSEQYKHLGLVCLTSHEGDLNLPVNDIDMSIVTDITN